MSCITADELEVCVQLTGIEVTVPCTTATVPTVVILLPPSSKLGRLASRVDVVHTPLVPRKVVVPTGVKRVPLYVTAVMSFNVHSPGNILMPQLLFTMVGFFLPVATFTALVL